MQIIAGYLYKPYITVIKNSQRTPNLENQQVYARPLELFRGIDNRVEIQLRNNELKKVNLLDHSLVLNLFDNANNQLLLSRQLNMVYTSTGLATTLIESYILDSITPGFYNYSLVAVSPEGEDQVVYTDDNYRATGQLRILDTIYPAPAESVQPRLGPFYNNSDTGRMGYSDRNQLFTDVITLKSSTRSSARTQTTQYWCTNFTGTIEMQGSLEVIPTRLPAAWFTVYTATPTAFTGSDYFNVQGKFCHVRFHITTNSGSVDKMLYRP